MTLETDITIATADGEMPAFEAKPEGEPHGAIVVVQEAFGVTEHIRDVARRLAASGWRAVAPAFFHRQGSPIIAYDDMPSVMPAMSALTEEGITGDLEATFGYLEQDGVSQEHIGVIGFCMGGTVTFYAATLRPLGAAVTFYGGGVAEGRFLPAQIDLAADLKTPWLGMYGDLDKSITSDQVEELRKRTSAASVPTEIVRYADADHGFHCDDRPAVFNPTAAKDAWEKALSWFDQHIGG